MPASTKGGSKQVEDGWEICLVTLEKTSAKQGFGIAISGGLDNPHFKTGDTSIIVSDIVQGSPADGKLKVGDILLSVNERNVDGHSHIDAVEALKAAGMQARMEVKRPSANPPKAKKVENLNDSKINGSKETDSERGRSRKKPKEMEQEVSDRKKHHSSSHKEGEQDGEKPHRHRSKSREKGDEEGEKSSRSHSKSREDNAEGEKSERSHRSRSKNREDNADGEKSHRSRSSNREDNAEGEKSGKSHRSRSKNREDNEEGEKTEKSHRSRSRNREDNAEGEKIEKSHRSRSRNREDNAEGEKTEKSHRSRSRNREDNAEGEKTEKLHRSRSRNREDNAEGEKTESSRKSKTPTDGVDGEKNDKHRSRSKTREDGAEGEKPRSRSTQRKPVEDADKLNSSKPKEENSDNQKVSSRSRSKSRSRDDLTRSKSKESLHRSKSKDALNAVETVTVVLNRGDQGYGFSLGQQIFVKDLAKDSPAAKAKNLEKGDIVREINGTPLDNLKISECIELIRGATETLTLTIVKKPKVEPQLPVEKPKSLEVGDEKVKSKELATGEKPKPSSRNARPQETSEAQVKTKAEKVQKESDQKLLGPKISQPDRHSSPVPSIDDHNNTKDSWADATPQKHYSSAAHPNQEVEDMNAKIDRLKANRKLERRMSQLPNAKVISFHKTGSVGIQVAGGNSVGIFVAAIRPDSAAAKEGLKPGDQIIMCNEIDFEDITREEAVLILLALPDDVSLVVESKQSTFDQIKKELGDNFFIRVNFDHAERANANELTFRKGEIFNVRDTMYQGLIGYWQAQRVGKNAQMLERGVLPNKSRAEQLAIAQKMEDRQALTPTKSKLKRKNSISGTLKKQKFVSQDRLDESSFIEGVQIPAYERVVLKVADFMRPVVVLGPLADLARIKLLEEMPDRFDVPSPSAYDNHGDNNSISLSEIRNVIAKNKHCLLDITPEGIEMLMYAQLCPIVVLLNSTSRSAVKELRQSLVKELLSAPTSVSHFSGDPMNAKQLKNVFNNANKLNEFYPHIFTSKINTHVAGADVLSRAFYEKLKEVIFTQQAQSAWMPEEKPDEMLDDMVFHQPNYISYASGVDSDTEGESTTSSPVSARKHYDDDESPLASPIDDAPVFMPPEPEKKKSADKVRERSKDRKRDPSDDRDGKSERSKKDKVSKAKNESVVEKSPPSAPVDKQSESTNAVKSSQGKDVTPNYNDYRDPPNGYRQPDYTESSKKDYRDSSRDDYRDPPSKRQLDEKIDESSRIIESNLNKEPDIGDLDQLEENIPVLRDPNYVLPKPIPDSPPSRSPPEVKIKPINSVKVLPTEIKTESSMDEKRRSLKKVGDVEDHYDTPKRPTNKEPEVLPPYRPSPPAEEVPTKVLSLQERMSKFQQKVVSNPPKVVPPRDESPPPRPLAPRNYIIDTRNQSAPQQQLFAQNSYKPTAQFAEVKRVLPKSNPVVEPYATMNFAPSVESSHPNYDYVKPRSQLTTNLDYDLPRQEHEQQSRPLIRNDSETHYKQPSKYDGYSVPSSNYKKPSNEDYYPAYKPPQDVTNYQDEDGDEEPKVIATARGWFDHRGGLLESSETNVSIYIPAGALPAGRQQEVYFKVCQDSKHMPPLDTSSGETLLSPLVMCGPHGLKFKKPIELRLPHKGATSDGMAFSLKSSDSSTVGGSGPGHWKNVKLGGRDLDSGRAYQVTDDTVSVLVDHF